MPKILDRLNKKKARDLRVLRDFVATFCRQKHRTEAKEPFALKNDSLREALGDKETMLCWDCARLLAHGMAKLLMCPYDPKPMCKKCAAHCYAPGYREKMRQVMRFSGLFMITHGRLDLIVHYFL